MKAVLKSYGEKVTLTAVSLLADTIPGGGAKLLAQCKTANENQLLCKLLVYLTTSTCTSHWRYSERWVAF